MAKQIGIIRLQGKVGELTFTNRNGNHIAGRNTNVDGQRIKTDPAFKRTRENMSEFGGSAKIASNIKAAFGPYYNRFKDQRTFNRLVTAVRSIMAKDTGVRGQRAFDIINNNIELVGFPLSQSDIISKVFGAPYSVIVNTDRNEATITIPDFNTSDYIQAPEGATHIRFLNVIGTVSEFGYSNVGKGYEPIVPEQNTLNEGISSTEIPIGGAVGSVTTITTTLGGTPVLDPKVGLFVAFGIEFLQDIGGTKYLFSSDNALQIVKIV